MERDRAFLRWRRELRDRGADITRWIARDETIDLGFDRASQLRTIRIIAAGHGPGILPGGAVYADNSQRVQAETHGILRPSEVGLAAHDVEHCGHGEGCRPRPE